MMMDGLVVSQELNSFSVFLIIVCHQYTHYVHRQYKAYNGFCSTHFNREMID